MRYEKQCILSIRLVILFLVFCLIYTAFQLNSIKDYNNNFIQGQIDSSFKRNIMSAFGSNLQIEDSYIKASSNVYSASVIYPLTSFKKEKNDQLDKVLLELHNFMLDDKNHNSIILKQREFFDLFNQFMMYPNDAENTKKLSNLIETMK